MPFVVLSSFDLSDMLVAAAAAAAQVNKEDLLSMVRYGAELVFSSEASNITGEASRPQRCRVAQVLLLWLGGGYAQ
jgi:hypothetical protein